MPVTYSLTYEGDLRSLARHDPSGMPLLIDAPVDNQGRGSSWSPTDLVSVGLGACIATVLGIVARRDGIPLQGATVRIEKHMSPQPPRRIARIVCAFAMPAGITATDRAKLERAARTCPVALSLHPDIAQDVGFHYPD